MKLKKVEIFGFKSFADKTSLVFHDGITCIVGPNGCGKSNIADAMRWVFGEQSAKSLRGDKMVDVIFAGSSARKSLNLAEVTITFTDVSGALPFEYEEIAVTRRLHRSGESDYFINKQPVRLKDIQNIFLDTGIGRTAFSIFEQGKLDQIIQYSPTGRRALFEEAAGITRYLQRKKETLKKFEAIDQNLSRVLDIFNEVEVQIVKLEEQSKKAKIYQSDRLSLEDLEKRYFYAQHSHFLRKENEIITKQEAATSALQEMQKTYESSFAGFKILQTGTRELEAEYSKMHEAMQNKLSEQKVRKEKEKLNREHLKELQAKKADYEKEITDLKNKKNDWSKEIEEGHARQKQHEAAIKIASDEASTSEKAFHSLENELAKLRDQQAKSHKAKMAHMQTENQAAQDLKTLRMRMDNHQEKKLQFEERTQKLQVHIQELEGMEKNQKDAFQKILKGNELLKTDLAEQDAKIKSCDDAITKILGNLEEFKKTLHENSARKNALQRLRDENEGFSAGSKKLLKEISSPGSPLFGLAKGLYEFISVEPGYESDLASILKRYSETIVVETRDQLQLLLSIAEQKKIHDFSVVCIEAIEAGKTNRPSPSFLDKVSENSLSCHFLKRIAMCNDVEQALEHSKKGYESLTAGKLFVDSFQVVHVRPSQENSIFVREAELKELAKKIKSNEKDLAQKESELKEQKELKQTMQAKRAKLDSEIRSVEIQLVEANFTLQKIQGERTKAVKECGQVREEIDTATHMLQQLQKQHEELEKKLLEERKKAERLVADDSCIEANLVKFVEERRKSGELLDAKRKVLFTLNDENRKNQHALNLLEVKRQECENSLKRISEEIAKQNVRIEQLIEGENQGKLDEAGIENSVKEKQEACNLIKEQIKIKKEEAGLLEAKNEGLLQEIKNSEKQVHHFEVQLAQIKTAKEAVVKTIEERFGGQRMPEDLELSFEKAEKEIKQLRHKLDQAQDINLSAIEDYEKCKERHQFLSEEIHDLSKAKKELEDAILTLDAESREIFEKTFLQIRSNFKKNFMLLFNGGEADLELVESSDVLEAGVEIVAKPPGKQMRSLSLLSGGEKCLTAMALLFSIFEVKAAPFCILDEIDAPLDDSNIERFVRVVKQFIDRCQFIIITHNKQTMSIADRIFGVSMQEKGVSKMLSIEFDRANERSRELIEVV